MILEWLAHLAALAAGWVAGLFPDWQVPAELLSADSMLNQVMALGNGLGVWVDWAFVGIVGAIPLGVWVFGLIFRTGRVAVGHVPQIGGNG